MEIIKLKRATVSDKFVNVIWSNDHVSQFPCVWLRDNCQSEKYFNSILQIRTLKLKDLNTEEIPLSVEVVNDDELKILWIDNHVSIFKACWLFDRRFEKDAWEKRLTWLGIDMKLWGSEMQDKIPENDFHKILNDDKECYNWLRNLEKYGLVLIKNTPKQVGQLKKIGHRISFLKQTHYGETFHVKVKNNPNNAAYTPVYLDLHTDMGYYEYTAGMQMLHCIENETIGGENEFCDGFTVANQLRENNKEKFDVLTSVGVDFQDIGEDVCGKFYKIHRFPTISINSKGEVWRIRFNNDVRDSYFNESPQKVVEFYDALKEFHKLLHDKYNKISYKLNPGEIICFNNTRILHARRAFDTNKSRHLEGGYIDWDELHDKMRVLRLKLEL